MPDLLSIGLSGLNAARTRELATANNIANLNTPGYQAQQANSAALPGNNGVAVNSVTSSNAPGRPISTGDTLELSPEAMQTNNVDLAREAVNLLKEQNTYQANAAIIRTGDQMAKTTIDLVG